MFALLLTICPDCFVKICVLICVGVVVLLSFFCLLYVVYLIVCFIVECCLVFVLLVIVVKDVFADWFCFVCSVVFDLLLYAALFGFSLVFIYYVSAG